MTGSFFSGTPFPLPDPMQRGFVVLRLDSTPSAPVRHATGYTQFEGFVQESGTEPSVLAGDLRKLVHFVQARPEILANREMLLSAGIFLGNSIAVAYPTAAWEVLDEPEIGKSGQGGFPVVQGVRFLIERPEDADHYLESLDTYLTTEPEAEVVA